MAEFERGHCTGCGYHTRWLRRIGHRPYCWRKTTMMLDIYPSQEQREKLLREMGRHWRIRSFFLAKKHHMYFQPAS